MSSKGHPPALSRESSTQVLTRRQSSKVHAPEEIVMTRQHSKASSGKAAVIEGVKEKAHPRKLQLTKEEVELISPMLGKRASSRDNSDISLSDIKPHKTKHRK